MKLPTLLLLVSATGLFAAEEAKPAATTAAPAVAAPAAPADAPKGTKNSDISGEVYYKYLTARDNIESSNTEVKTLKSAAEAAKAKAKTVTKEEKSVADKEAKQAEKLFTDTRLAAVIKDYPEFAEVGKKIDDEFQNYINKRVGIENNDPNVKALKVAAEAAKTKAKSAVPADKAKADKESKEASEAHSKARSEALIKKYPELADVHKKINDFWTKNDSAKKKKKAAEATATATDKAAAPATK
jgi:hypothetical protein